MLSNVLKKRDSKFTPNKKNQVLILLKYKASQFVIDALNQDKED